MAIIQTVLAVLIAFGIIIILAILIGRLMVHHLLSKLELLAGTMPRIGPMEILFGLSGVTLREYALAAQRATSGHSAMIPMEPPLRRTWLEDVRFDPATLSPAARPRIGAAGLAVTLGPRALRPLRLAFPVIISGMGFGLGVSAQVRRAIAEACTLTGIALNSGEGPALPTERAIAHRWIFQWGRARWRGTHASAQIADMIELQVGQASEGGIAIIKPRARLPRTLRRLALLPGPIHIRSGLPIPLPRWLRRAHAAAPEIPIGVKLPASDHVEQDLALLLSLGIDVITLDGAGAGSSDSPAVLADHQGVPIAVALVRAQHWLAAQGLRDRVSLVVSGHIHSAADIAKLLALGADAVAVGSMALFALAHGQATTLLPARSPTALLFSGPHTVPERLNADLAAERLTNWLTATRDELGLIGASLGLTDISEIAVQHLVADTEETAHLLRIHCYAAPTEDHLARASARIWDTLARDAVAEWQRGAAQWQRLLGLVQQRRRMAFRTPISGRGRGDGGR